MAGKILIVGECPIGQEARGTLGGFDAVVCSTPQDAAAKIKDESDIYLIVICREQGDADGYDLARQLEKLNEDLRIPIVVVSDQEGFLQALTSAHPHHAALLDAIFNQSTLGIAVGLSSEPSEPSGNLYPIINDTFLRITGRSRRELVELGWEQVLHPQDAAQDRVQRRLLEKGIISGYSLEQRLLRPDGSQVWVELTAAPFDQPGKGSRKTIYMIKDISDRKAIEERLSESERSKAVLLKNLPGMAYRCLLDRAWTMQFVSEGCEPLTGYPAESLLYNRDISFNELIAPEYSEVLWENWQVYL
jgi:PAS domain S-box-containing protein